MARSGRVTLAAAFTAGSLLTMVGWRGSTILLRRRTPDPADLPSNYGITYNDVRFPSRDGIPLAGWWLIPEQPNGAALVLCHGHNGSMDGDMAQMARFVQAGFHVLMFNFRAHGGSGGEHVTFGAREYFDVLGALDWLEREQGMHHAGLVGFSMGAGVALMAAAHDNRVGAVVADGTILRVADAIIGFGREKGLPAGMVRPLAALILAVASLRAGVWIPSADPVRWACEARCPVLFVQGGRDPFVSYAAAETLTRLAWRCADLWVVPGAGHRDAYRLDPAAYYVRVLGFLERSLLKQPMPES
ncbi:MAG: alpha/beta fold hydrolase [Anaerolineae bacterium]|nr:alpha/beta fold hydrolase [Anaerolineae bacterium]